MTLAFDLLDTDTANVAIKSRSAAIEARLVEIPPDRLCLSAVTRAALMDGLKRLPAGHRLHAGVRPFFTIVPVLACNDDAADHHAEIRHQLATRGLAIGDPDLMIAAHTLAIGAVPATDNRRSFERISVCAPLVFEHWLQAHLFLASRTDGNRKSSIRRQTDLGHRRQCDSRRSANRSA